MFQTTNQKINLHNKYSQTLINPRLNLVFTCQKHVLFAVL